MTEPLHVTLKNASQTVALHPITLGDVFAMHGSATQGALLVLLAVPCLLPLPGAGTLMSLGIAAMVVPMWCGQSHCTLPKRVANLQLPPASAQRVLHVLAWFYAKAGVWAHARMTHLTQPAHRHWMAAWVAAMSLLIFLPIPFGNVLPALGLLLLGLGLIHRDGLAVLVGVAMGLLALLLTTVLGIWAWELGRLGGSAILPL